MSKPASAPPAPFVNQWPTWLIAVWAATVSGIAGFINADAFISAFKIPVTHMTGSASRVALCLGKGDFAMVEFGRVGAIMVSFVLGAALSGMIVGTRVLKPGRRYGIVWAVEGAILCAAAGLFETGEHWHDLRDTLHFAATCLLAGACGLQNAMASSYLGMVLRTTHLTGVLTDLGVFLGHWLKREPVPKNKVAILSSILGGFILGGVAAAGWDMFIKHSPLPFLGAGLLVFGLCYYAHRVRVRRKRESIPAAIADE